MLKNWVINASPIISLARINLASLVLDLPDTSSIPSGVIDEINQGPDTDPAKLWLRKHGAEKSINVGPISNVVSAWDLGKGETQVIHLAYTHPGMLAILDDRAARNCAAALGIEVMGTIGVILVAKNRGLVREVKPLLLQLENNGFRLGPELLSAALRIAAEL